MVQVGQKIYQMNDLMSEMSEYDLHLQIMKPSDEIHQKLTQLNRVKLIDHKLYTFQKKMLPYFVCAHFEPAIRKSENFCYTKSFILDFDHIAEHGFILDDLKSKLIKDERVMMCFSSPSKNGLKVLFKMEEACYDYQIMAVFVKSFSTEFATEYGIDEILDRQCFDVTRACFFSEDADCYYNENAKPLNMRDHIQAEKTYDLFGENAAVNAVIKAENEEEIETLPTEQAFDFIKSKLNPKAIKIDRKQYFVPDEIENILPQLLSFIEDCQLEVEQVSDIHYGKKFQLKSGISKAEVNLFYGKKGFTIVESPKSGTNSELNSLCADLIKTFLYDRGLLI